MDSQPSSTFSTPSLSARFPVAQASIIPATGPAQFAGTTENHAVEADHAIRTTMRDLASANRPVVPTSAVELATATSPDHQAATSPVTAPEATSTTTAAIIVALVVAIAITIAPVLALTPALAQDRVTATTHRHVATQVHRETTLGQHNLEGDDENMRRFAQVMRSAQRRELPRKGSRHAPTTWDGEPARLREFFHQVEDLFEDYGVEGRERVTVLVEYVDTLTEGIIRELESFRRRDYNELKRELKELMGDRGARPKYRVADLDALVRESSSSTFKSEKEYHATYLRFLQMLKWLLRARKLHNEECNLKFWNMFSTRLQKRLRTRLEIKLPNHPRSEPYPMSAVHEAAIHILDDQAFDRPNKGDGRTWLERKRASRRSRSPDPSRGRQSRRRNRSISSSSSSSDSRSRSPSPKSPSPERRDSRVRWKDRGTKEPKPDEAADSMRDLLEQMGRLTIDDPEYRRTYRLMQQKYPQVAATLKAPSSNVPLAESYPATPPRSTFCFYCAKDGCRIGTCPVLAEHMKAGLVNPDPSNPKFVLYKDGSRLYPYPGGGRAADVDMRVKREREREAPSSSRQAAMIRIESPRRTEEVGAAYLQRLGYDSQDDEFEQSDTEEMLLRALEAVRAKGATRTGKPYERSSGNSERRRGKSSATADTLEQPHVPPTMQTTNPTPDEKMADAETKRGRAPPQYRYTSQAETHHDDDTYLNKVLDLPLNGSAGAVRLRELIGSSLPLRKGLVDYLKTQRVPIEPKVTGAIVAALGVPEPLVHSRLERFVIRVAGCNMVALKDEGSEINLISSAAQRKLGLPLDVNHRINMEGVNPGTKRSEGLCENVILSSGGVDMRVHLHVFDNSPFDILLGQPWKAQYVVSEHRSSSGVLEMVVCDHRDRDRQVAVVLRDPSDTQWEARLDALQLPRVRRGRQEGDHGAGMTHDMSHFNGQPSGVSPVEVAEEEDAWEVCKWQWVGSIRRASKAKYKPVARKVRPVDGVLPDDARTTRQFPEDPLKTLPPVPQVPPEFKPGLRLTRERLESLDLAQGGFLWPEEQRLFAHILRTNEHALAFDESEKGRFRDDYFSPYRIATIPHVPWQDKPIPIPPGIWPKVPGLVKSKLQNGTYEWSQSSYRGRMFPVLKKDGSPRLVHDMQKLNAVTIRDSTLPPNIEDVVESFAGRSCFTVFDIFVGYDNRTLALESRDLTSFLVPGFGLLRLTSLPMGATNAMAEFQACMTFILQDEIPGVASVFVDDCGIKGPPTRYETGGSFETLAENPGIRRFIWEHALDVNRVLHRIGHSGATVSAPKLQLAVSEVHLLGSICTYEGRLPDQSKVSKILNWPKCANPAEVRGFLGTCGVVRAWIKGYSAVARPLTALLRKGLFWSWGEPERIAMQRLKELVANAPCLAPLDYSTDRETILAVDSSHIAVGFILYQLDDSSRRVPVRFGSLTFNERESRYSQPKLELYGLFRALRKWRPYVISVKNLVVEVDAQYIRGMLNSPELLRNAMVGRWAEEISTYSFRLRHVRAGDHTAADGLSRRHRAPEDTDSDESNREVAGESHMVTVARMDGWEGRDEVEVYNVGADRWEAELEEVWRMLDSQGRPEGKGEVEARSMARKARGFLKIGDQLWRRRSDGQHQLVLPFDRRMAVLTQVHDEMGHKGAWSTARQLSIRFWWPGLEKECAEFVKTCTRCQLRTPRNVHLPLQVSTPQTPFRRLHADIVFLPAAQGYSCAILARDDLTRYLEARRLRKANARGVSTFLWEEVLTRWGAIQEIVTDNGTEFKGAVEILLKRFGVNQIRISAYNKQANGVVERGHRTFREALLRSCDRPSSWPDMFHAALWAERATVRKATGYSPYFLAHGTHPLLPLNIVEMTFLFGHPEPMSTVDLISTRTRMLAKLDSAIEKARERLTQSRYRSKAQFERAHASTLRREPFTPGTPVLVRNSRFDSEFNAKSHDRWLGPYLVVRVGRNGAYRLAEFDGSVLAEAIAANRVIEFYPRSRLVVQPDAVLDREGWERVEEQPEIVQTASDSSSLGDYE